MNIHTTEEAKKKWCPFARTPNYINITAASTNRNLNGEALNSSLCIGPACMAWQWTADYESKRSKDANCGYCGLAVRA